jgi:hypothetical protein
MRFLTPAEIVDLAEAIHARYRALVFVGAYGGLRMGELPGSAKAASICWPGRSPWPRPPPRSKAS